MSSHVRWRATVTGTGVEPFSLEADSRDALEQELGDLADLHLGRLKWTIEEVSVPVTGGPDGGAGQRAEQLGMDL